MSSTELSERSKTVDKSMKEKKIEKGEIGSDKCRMLLSSSASIGPEGGRIDVGQCYVEFQPGTFRDVRNLKLTAKVDSSEWPESKEVITPVLHVDVNEELCLEADVQLSTWVVPERSLPLVQVLRYCHEKNEWEVFHELPLENSKFIRFKCKKFSKIVAMLAGLLSLPISFRFEPSIFAFRRNLIFCIHLKDRVIRKSVSKYIQKDLSEVFHVSRVPLKSLNCRRGDKVLVHITCSKPEGQFTISPSNPSVESIDLPLLMGEYSSTLYALWGGDDHKEVLMDVEIGKEGNLKKNPFVHYLTPDAIGSLSSDRQPDSQAATCNTYNIDRRHIVTDTIVHGTMTANYEDCDINVSSGNVVTPSTDSRT